MASQDIGRQLAEKTFQELSRLAVKPEKVVESGIGKQRFGKLERQWTSDQGYKASAAWQTASLLRDLVLLWTTTYLPIVSRNSPVNPGTISRLRTQMEDAARSMVSTFEEGWGRPSTKEFLDFIGFSQGSLNEIRGDFERCLTDSLVKSSEGSTLSSIGVPTPSRSFPYPPVVSRRAPSRYGNLREKLREYTGKEIQAELLTYEVFKELTNKTSFLYRKTIDGLLRKLSENDRKALQEKLENLWSRYW